MFEDILGAQSSRTIESSMRTMCHNESKPGPETFTIGEAAFSVAYWYTRGI